MDIGSGRAGRAGAGRWGRLRRPAAVLLGVGLVVAAIAASTPGVCADGKKAARPARPGPATPAPRPQAAGPRWVRVVYDDLVDRTAITHRGRTVGALLDGAIPKSADPDLQPYLEPFSFVCNDIAAAAGAPGDAPFASIAADYPPGSRQPAWAALFREGHFQLFLGGGRARLFLKGEKPAALFERDHGVVRHALLEALEKAGTDRLTVEVYAFRNDYATRTLRLDLNPFVTEIAARDCAPKARPLPLDGLAAFFAPGPVLEAAEIDDNGDFFLYGSGAAGQTVAGARLSLEDFAVVYRAVFHNGRNPPYVSLDRDEDNRFAKVNFGGLLEDTRVGSVLLESDRLFKTMISGIDPDARTPAAGRIRSVIPEFRTVDDRGLFVDRPDSGRARFWFYPDRIRTVTDGRIGVVSSSLFTADEERLDGRPRRTWAGRETIDHLNANFPGYASVLSPYRELETVGRLMAIAKWLQTADSRRRADLDGLLSVELPPHRTPRRTRRILAATEGLRVSRGASVKDYRFVSCLDNVLDAAPRDAGDTTLVEMAKQHVRRQGVETMLPAGMSLFTATGTRYTVTSISGGVNLDPAAFAAPVRSPDSPLIARIRARRPAGAGRPPVRAGGMTRSPPGQAPPQARDAGKPPRPNEDARGPGGSRPPGGRPAAGPEPRRRGGPVIVTAPSYPAEIIVTGDLSKGGTIVLRKGKPLGPGTGVPPPR